MKVVKLGVSLLAALFIGGLIGWMYAPISATPSIVIDHIVVGRALVSDGTVLEITTGYRNSGCEQVLLSRFLLNTKPTPAIALPQQHGDDVLPAGNDVVVERVPLGIDLPPGEWHLFSVVSCYVDSVIVPGGTVAPTALFEVS